MAPERHRSERPAVAPGLLLRPLPELLDALGCDTTGLSSQAAAQALTHSGPNQLEHRAGPGLLRSVLRQLGHPLALLLWAAAVLAYLSQGAQLATAIVAVIAINAAFALLQERHAEHAVAALTAYLPPHATVVRDGVHTRIEATQVVPGDLLVVEEGDAVCADARLVSGAVEVDLSAINGESAPVPRAAATSPDGEPQRTRLDEAPDVVLSGTTCLAGEGTAVVACTAMSTELGRIARLSSRHHIESSPLERQVRRVAWLIALVAIGVGLAFLPLGMLAGLSFTDTVVFAIGLLVANVPEGLLPTITLALAVGVADLARQGGLVRRLSAVETLGSADVICTDKTGTLTQNRMRVHSVWDASARTTPDRARAEDLARLLRACTTADQEAQLGDPTELALLAAADRLSPEAPAPPRQQLLHFDPRRRLMSVVVLEDGQPAVWTKGAPDAVLERCTRAVGADGARPLDQAERRALEHRLLELADHGLRLIACARRRLPGTGTPASRDELERDLDLLGVVALSDPVRDAVPAAVRRAHTAGIHIHVITGDHGATAAAVAREAGIGGDHPQVLTGNELDALDDDAVDRILAQRTEIVFARSSPEDKLRIAERLQRTGHVVAMTGDGVNDAPALRTADIGVAMGLGGTDVAREAATMVLVDDDFATIIRAVHAGRRVYDNVRKFIVYILTHTVPEVVPFLLFALSGGAVPLGLTVTQILIIDLGTDTLPALALGRERAEPGVMTRPPRPRGENIVQREMLLRAWGVMGLASAVLVTTGFLWVLRDGGWSPGEATGPGSPLHETYLQATTMAFAGIVACQVGTAMAVRTERVSLRSIGVLSNPLLLLGITVELTLTAAVVYLPPANQLLGTRPLEPRHLLALAGYPVIVWGVDEIYRAVRRRSRSRAPAAPAQERSRPG